MYEAGAALQKVICVLGSVKLVAHGECMPSQKAFSVGVSPDDLLSMETARVLQTLLLYYYRFITFCPGCPRGCSRKEW